MGSESKCIYCDRKCIVRSYMKICDPCGSEKKLCVKCGQEYSASPSDPSKTKEMKESMNEYIAMLRERSRRTVLRKLDKK